ncbi:hypothetical protein OR1_02402 [Geobacter sp. OR-1]|uniref:hypothetical protein n=1 Tax=Geobacter sp. OR-1 TaxID=1266765 RepID=UPI0005433E9E|nr:hypothetical protein [Geobacter sp. OR-1]GAM10114.1 hypothetical protein OR1_02402 [Geobacter sp. OR-1]
MHYGPLLTLLMMATLLASPYSAAADDEVTSKSQVPPATFIRRLEPDRLLTSGGMRVKPGSDVTVEPEFGVSHTVHQRETGIGRDDITHKVHAQAGGRIRLSDLFYLGFATKLPIYNYEATEGRTPGGGAAPATAAARHEYEILKLSPENLTWTGEMGFRLGQQVDLNLYYDQNILKGPYQRGTKSGEDVFGTRFIFRFK